MSAPNNLSPRLRLEFLLKIHHGRCFVPESAIDFLGLSEAAESMESEKLASIEVSTVGIVGFTLTRKGFSPKRFKLLEPEIIAH